MIRKDALKRFQWFEKKTRQRQYPNSISLAEKFEISARTAMRDIRFLRDELDCPLLYDQRQKGYYFEEGIVWTLHPIYLSSDEIGALMLARQLLQEEMAGLKCLAPRSGNYMDTGFTSAIEKILSVINEKTGTLGDIISVQTIGVAPATEKIFMTVLRACMQQCFISFDYISPTRGLSEGRTVEPYHLLNYMGTWHLIGYCHSRHDIRDFVLCRMKEVRMLSNTFHIHKGLEGQKIRDYLKRHFGVFRGGNSEYVTLKFSPFKAQWIREQVWHHEQEMKELGDGSLVMSFPVADFTEVKMEILRHGADVEVMAPPELRKIIAEEIRKMGIIY